MKRSTRTDNGPRETAASGGRRPRRGGGLGGAAASGERRASASRLRPAPVTDLARSRGWYQSRLGYQVVAEFVEQGQLMGYTMAHPNGGPPLGLRLDPDRARAAAGFDYFAIGVPDKDAIVRLADRLTALGEEHAGVHWASIGWILPLLHDPDGHEVRFYTHEHHTEPEPGKVTTIHDPREASERRERATA